VNWDRPETNIAPQAMLIGDRPFTRCAAVTGADSAQQFDQFQIARSRVIAPVSRPDCMGE
jgi:hypothetical protein